MFLLFTVTNSDAMSILVCTPLGVFVLELVQDRGSELVFEPQTPLAVSRNLWTPPQIQGIAGCNIPG